MRGAEYQGDKGVLGAEVIALVQGGCSTGWLAQQKIEKIGKARAMRYRIKSEE